MISQSLYKSNEYYIIVGSQWGDEGKGKIVDELVSQAVKKFGGNNVVVVGSNGGSNAGHTVCIEGIEHHVHYLTSGVFNKEVRSIMGAGKVIEPISLGSEVRELLPYYPDIINRTCISEKTHITTLGHLITDGGIASKQIGTTRKGIGPTYSTRALRTGLRICDVIDITDVELAKRLGLLYKSMGINDLSKSDKSILYTYRDPQTNKQIEITYETLFTFENDIKNIRWLTRTFRFITQNTLRRTLLESKNTCYIFELSNATMLDPTYGTYPNVTSSMCTTSGILDSLGLNIVDIAQIQQNASVFEIIGVVKSYPTRVGTGALPTLLKEYEYNMAMNIINGGNEFGVTTGRMRRPGWLDLVQLKHAIKVNGINTINITRLDNLGVCDKIKICVGYRLPYGVVIKGDEYYPSTEGRLYRAEPIYKTFNGWLGFDFTKVNKYEDLHENVKDVIAYIEDELNTVIKYINLGKDRGMVLVKPDKDMKRIEKNREILNNIIIDKLSYIIE